MDGEPGRPQVASLNQDPGLPLDDPKHEQFAQLLALEPGITQPEAHERAGFSGGRSAAATMAGKSYIKARIQYIRQDFAERMMLEAVKTTTALNYSKDDAMAEAEQIRLLAIGDADYKSALGAVVLKARLAGHLVEQGPRTIRTLDDFSLEEGLNLLDQLNRISEARRADPSRQIGSGPVIAG